MPEAKPTGAILVIIPTYNERGNLDELLSRLFGLDIAFDMLFVDDNSPDGTGKIIASSTSRFGLELLQLLFQLTVALKHTGQLVE